MAPAPVARTNTVQLTGRLAAAPIRTILPSGDQVVSLRLVVDRPARTGRRSGARHPVDTIDCSIWTAALARRVERWEPGDVVSLEGALRRRFWRSPGGARSRYDVEVSRARRLR